MSLLSDSFVMDYMSNTLNKAQLEAVTPTEGLLDIDQALLEYTKPPRDGLSPRQGIILS